LTHDIDPIGKLAELIKQSRFPQKDIAAQVGIPNSYLSEILSGKANPSIKMVFRIADAVTFLVKNAVTNRAIINDLARVKASFQSRAIAKALGDA